MVILVPPLIATKSFPQNIPKKFRPLVELLGGRRVTDCQTRVRESRLLRTTVGDHLQKQGLYTVFRS